jgi:thioredoxin reductase (NADPH)
MVPWQVTLPLGVGHLALLTDVRVAAITHRSVELVRAPYDEAALRPDREQWLLPNDFVFALVGHTADPLFFAHLGVALGEEGMPIYDDATAETTIPGLFIAGALSRANIILESRRRAVEIVALIAARLGQAPFS